MKRLSVIVFCLMVSGCSSTSQSSFTSPDGRKVEQVKCKGEQTACYNLAQSTCKGSYQVLDSESRAGNIADDTHPAEIPTMWYTMTFACGKSDGKLASFPLKGVTATPGAGPSFTNCNRIGNSMNCMSY